MSEVALAPLSTLWSAMAPRRALAAEPLDVGQLISAAEARGHAAGRAEALAELAPVSTAFRTATDALLAAHTVDPAALQPLFTDLVTRICTAVVGAELRLSPDCIARLVAEGLAAVENEGEAIVHLSPNEAPHVDGAVADPELADGEVRVETPAHVVAASLTARLAAIVEGLA